MMCLGLLAQFWPKANRPLDEVIIKVYFVYFAQSLKNNKVYVGYTSKKPVDRLREHNQGSNIWSKQNGPFKLIYYESFICKKDAENRENFYKTGFGKRIKKAIVEEMGS